ncbi:MAG: endodeoxyribonuclease [Betaproteobacteria bacterium]|nr:MAG: endodeoxyribonuclease [Betaproteobacteria bacterium]
MSKKIVGFEKYVIHRDGSVERLGFRGGLLTNSKTTAGYPKVTLYQKPKTKTFLVHRLLADAYIPNPLGLTQVNHKNGDKGDNRLSNLEWVTPRENQAHAVDIGLKGHGEKLYNSKFTDPQVREIRRASKDETQISIAKRYNVSKQTINQLLKGKTYGRVI